jgi:hypothetical protein
MSIPRCLQVSLLLLPLGPLLFGCGDGGVEPPTVATVEVSPGTQALTAIGATHQFSAVARDASGNPIAGQTFTWASSATSVATVSATGLVTAVENGTATITATVAGVSGSAALTVSQVVATVEVSRSVRQRTRSPRLVSRCSAMLWPRTRMAVRSLDRRSRGLLQRRA